MCTAISPRVSHLKDERWHHVVMSVDDAREVVRFSVDNADAAMPLVCLWLSTPPPPPSPPPSPPSPPPPNPPPSPPSPPSPPPSPPSPPPLRYRSPNQKAAAAQAAAARLGGVVHEVDEGQYTTPTLGDENDDEGEVEVEEEDDTHIDSGPGLSGAARNLLGGCSRRNCVGRYYRVYNCNRPCGGGQYMNRFSVSQGASCGGSCNYPDKYYNCNVHACPPPPSPPPLPLPPPPSPPPPLPDFIPLEDQIDGPDKAATTESHSYLVDPTEKSREYSSSSSKSSSAAAVETFSSMLDSPNCWSAKQDAFGADGAGLKAEWMQIAVSRELRIRGVAVRRPDSGSSADFVTKLKVLVGASADALYPVVGGVFETGLESAANATVVRLTFPGAGVLGKVVRIVPLTWVGDEVALRAAIIADSTAWPAHEVIDPPEESRKYSSVLTATPTSETANSRLASPTGWTAAHATKGEWLQCNSI